MNLSVAEIRRPRPGRLYCGEMNPIVWHRGRVLVTIVAAGVALSLLAPHAQASAERWPFPQHEKYVKHSLTPNHRTQQQLDDDVRLAYWDWKRSYLVDTGQSVRSVPLKRVAYGRPGTANHSQTVSEGQGYGMVIVATMAGEDPQAQTEFDGLWLYARANPSGIDKRLMTWHVPIGDTGNDAAFDGDADIAYGLILADAQWGSTGRINYRAQARRVIRGIHTSMIGPRSRLPMLGDWVEARGRRFHEFTPRTSDLMTGHFRAFRRFTHDARWRSVVRRTSKTVGHLQSLNPRTGLLPDFTVPRKGRRGALKPAPAGYLEGANDGRYGYNAGRVPWRLATDGLINAKPKSLAQARRISRWAQRETQGRPTRFRAGYRLNGNPAPNSKYFTTFFVAPLGVAAMTDRNQQAWLNRIYDSVSHAREDYYSDSVALLSMLVMTHNFWDPTAD